MNYSNAAINDTNKAERDIERTIHDIDEARKVIYQDFGLLIAELKKNMVMWPTYAVEICRLIDKIIKILRPFTNNSVEVRLKGTCGRTIHNLENIKFLMKSKEGKRLQREHVILEVHKYMVTILEILRFDESELMNALDDMKKFLIH
ncbi:hypothetical protein K9M79_05870 [Candidatus Woesearchaeota archaeon]|nr:hypothetical protein [Candidatus Woesearchaeota archaeon]